MTEVHVRNDRQARSTKLPQNTNWLRNYGSQGILKPLSGMLLARPTNYPSEMVHKLYDEIRRILRELG